MPLSKTLRLQQNLNLSGPGRRPGGSTRKSGACWENTNKRLSKVTVTEGGEELSQFITNKEGIKDAALEEYESRLHLTTNLDMMQGTLVEHFQHLGTGWHAQQVLEGTYVPPLSISEHTVW